MLSAYNAGPAGGYQSGYVNTTLQNAKTYGAGGGSIPAETTGGSAASSGGTTTIPGAPSRTVERANPHAKGYALLASLISKESGAEGATLARLIAAKGEPITETIPGTEGSSASVPVSSSAETGTGSTSTSEGKSLHLVPPPVKVTLPASIQQEHSLAGDKWKALRTAKHGLERFERGPVSLNDISRIQNSSPNLVQNALNTEAEQPIAQVHNGRVVRDARGNPIFVPHKKVPGL